MTQFRQGDVFIEKVETIPGDVKPGKLDGHRIVLAYGEVTGHAHAIVAEEGIELFEKGDTLYLRVTKPEGADLKHEEHATITLEPGEYKVNRQREYSPEEVRFVAD